MSKQRRAYDKIKAFLVENGFKHRDVAKVIDTKPNTVSKKLNGFGDFTLEEAKKIHTEMGVPITYFFECSVPIKERKSE
ncbi:antitoxin component HigA of HigAB toxin-antitoxin module [Bacillus thermophilus]|uniref:Antitoxin component HigA of HigAB toxin-antitoxin module n=1 Tax=Siminovitchia thermophila TaxID=1245522 RepID=A0ABS2RC60_9BACI|nr:helix-turn-helix transcriptional regulator [Siminovitchia thermophila]MBM7717242.1 antitoxin component HigA of HigAB toxin-antitoxin module [Siminovitchia thermophila]ONK22991.1 transcriptional regulator [Bacillus sp. VT-16-64]